MSNRIFTFFVFILSLLFIIALIVININSDKEKVNKFTFEKQTTSGVCPPFNLYDEDGNIIDPVNKINSDVPYSPKQTCGAKGCHDYNKITQGFHFQQGKDEKPTEIMSKRYEWVTSPGNYGGNWCSPAPLYRALAKKKNNSAQEIDMTSYEFVTATCGYCHPGSGPLEFDRDGIRYDKKMSDIMNKLTAGGDNNFDGDYYKARWNETGVIEGDCMLCHLPEYDYKHRNAMLDSLNFKWAATEGSGLGKIEGSIKSKQKVKVIYDLTKFDKDGKVSMHFVREPRNETCLNCHAKPDWKKRGTDFSPRRDVHIAAGLKCVDCHAAGKNAPSKLIRGKEEHQLGKGDDPSGNVRNDLDNTVRTCQDCHINGYLNAPIAKHSWLPPLHMEKLACQTCHIPVKSVKSALVQVSDVYNRGSKISPPAKRIWTFYDQNMKYWNHYGELNMFTVQDIPTDEFKPIYALYKDKIYPVNPVHSSWPGILTVGKESLDQPKMKDIYTMWIEHLADSSKYPSLMKITDDNDDGIPEVNNESEIDAFINSVNQRLKDLKYDMSGKQVVWVNNDKVYTNSKNFFIIDKHVYESSPYASVYKYSHNVFPSKSALGINGCTDCHSSSSGFFTSSVVKYPFSDDGKLVTEMQYSRMDISAFTVYLGIIREEYLKKIFYYLLVFVTVTIVIFLILKYFWKDYLFKYSFSQISYFLLFVYTIILIIGVILYQKHDLIEYVLPSRFVLDSNHFLLSTINIFISLICLYLLSSLDKKTRLDKFLLKNIFIFLFISLITGFFMLVQIKAMYSFVKYAYTLFDFSQVLLTICILITIFKFKANFFKSI